MLLNMHSRFRLDCRRGRRCCDAYNHALASMGYNMRWQLVLVEELFSKFVHSIDANAVECKTAERKISLSVYAVFVDMRTIYAHHTKAHCEYRITRMATEK